MKNLSTPPETEDIVEWLRINEKVLEGQKVVRVFCWVILIVLVILEFILINNWVVKDLRLSPFLSTIPFIILSMLTFAAVFYITQRIYINILRLLNPNLKRLEIAKRLNIEEYAEALEIHRREVFDKELQNRSSKDAREKALVEESKSKELLALEKQKEKDKKALGLN